MKLPPPFDDALILTGPTASGKSALALELATRLNAEIIAMDSMTLYRGMDIGTAKPTPTERAAVSHHLIDVLDPWESGNVAWWLEQARQSCRAIQQRGKRVLFVGGTPFYLKAIVQGLFECPPANPELRQRLDEDLRVLGGIALHERLSQIDPGTARRLHPNDTRRVLRALEIWHLTGKPASEMQRQGWWAEGSSDPEAGNREDVSDNDMPRCLAIDLPRDELYARIDKRVVQMIGNGWVDEVRQLRQLPRPWAKEPSQALGYREIAAYLDGHRTLEEATSAIQMRSRQFAKRQLTWFRGLSGCRLCEGKLTFRLWEKKMS